MARRDGNMPWKDAIAEVLRRAGTALHYTEIAERIVTEKLRTDVGATPAATVNSYVSMDSKAGGASSFIRPGRGLVMLRGTPPATAGATAAPPPHDQPVAPTGEEPEEGSAGVIKAFGMYWSRAKVEWGTEPRLLGQQQLGADKVDFCAQKGIYLLQDGREVIYVGRTTDQSLGRRLYQHTIDRLSGRWDRFSWFGLLEVNDKGELVVPGAQPSFGDLIVALEAILIESVEPPLNRRRGDAFAAVEYMQVEDPALARKREAEMIRGLLDRSGRR